MTLPQSILATLAYHDIFDYPLNAKEIHKYLIGKQASFITVEKALSNLSRVSTSGVKSWSNIASTPEVGKEKTALYALPKRQRLFQIRKQRSRYSKAKLKRAYFYATLLMLIPTLKMVAISGALAMENSHKDDDIDFVLVSFRGSLWTTRFLANLLLFPFKRKPQPGKLITSHFSLIRRKALLITNNKACLNLYLDESDLGIKSRNLYTAHELVQMKILWDRDKTYNRLIKSNGWVTNFLPNWTQQSDKQSFSANKRKEIRDKSFENFSLFTFHLSLVEILLKRFQLAYMKSKISTEQIGEHQLFFHPGNTREWVLKEYQKKLKKLKIDVV